MSNGLSYKERASVEIQKIPVKRGGGKAPNRGMFSYIPGSERKSTFAKFKLLKAIDAKQHKTLESDEWYFLRALVEASVLPEAVGMRLGSLLIGQDISLLRPDFFAQLTEEIDLQYREWQTNRIVFPLY